MCFNGSCTHPPTNEGGTCEDDGNPCTYDLCQDGVCEHPNKPDCTLCVPGGGAAAVAASAVVPDGRCLSGACVTGSCTLAVTSGAGCPGQTVDLTLTGTCQPQQTCPGDTMVLSMTKSVQYLIFNWPDPIPCDGTEYERTVTVEIDPTAPPSPIVFEILGTTPVAECSTLATVGVFGDAACATCPVGASTLTVTEAALVTACPNDYGVTFEPDVNTQVLAIETCLDGGPCHIEFRVTATRDMESDPCPGNYTNVTGGGDPNVTPANVCAMVDGFWNGGVANSSSGAFTIGGISYGNTVGVELHEDAHVTEYVILLNLELPPFLAKPSMAPIPMDGNPPGQSCAQAIAARTAAITIDVELAYDAASNQWVALGEGQNGYNAEQPHYENVARSICQWAKDQATIDVDTCATCKNGALGIVYTDVCGDNAVNEPGEDCDGTDDSACPNVCRTDCTCPP